MIVRMRALTHTRAHGHTATQTRTNSSAKTDDFRSAPQRTNARFRFRMKLQIAHKMEILFVQRDRGRGMSISKLISSLFGVECRPREKNDRKRKQFRTDYCPIRSETISRRNGNRMSSVSSSTAPPPRLCAFVRSMSNRLQIFSRQKPKGPLKSSK